MTTHSLWRIGTDSSHYTAIDVSGKGGEITGGRWNRKGTAVLYTSESVALACLETLVNLNASGLPLKRYLIEIRVPVAIWARRTIIDIPHNIGWDAAPAGKVSLDWGDEWLKSQSSLLAVVPSVVVSIENNILINPRHADAHKLTLVKLSRWTYDARLSKR